MGYQKEHTCLICKEGFISYNSNGMFCPVCRATRKKEYSKEYLRKRRAELRNERNNQKKEKKKVQSVSEIQRLANAAGMTYGQYTAMLEMQKGVKS